jgi:hypothetical protein
MPPLSSNMSILIADQRYNSNRISGDDAVEFGTEIQSQKGICNKSDFKRANSDPSTQTNTKKTSNMDRFKRPDLKKKRPSSKVGVENEKQLPPHNTDYANCFYPPVLDTKPKDGIKIPIRVKSNDPTNGPKKFVGWIGDRLKGAIDGAIERNWDKPFFGIGYIEPKPYEKKKGDFLTQTNENSLIGGTLKGWQINNAPKIELIIK